jgi:hypothetical protein
MLLLLLCPDYVGMLYIGEVAIGKVSTAAACPQFAAGHCPILCHALAPLTGKRWFPLNVLGGLGVDVRGRRLGIVLVLLVLRVIDVDDDIIVDCRTALAAWA